MTTKLEDLESSLQKSLLDAREVADAAEKEGRDFTGEEREKVKKILDEAKDLKAKIKEAKSDDELKNAVDALGEGIELMTKSSSTSSNVIQVAAGKGSTIGEQFVNSPEYKSFLGQFSQKDEFGNVRIPDKARVQSQPVGFKTIITGGTDTSAGAFVNTDTTGIYEGLGYRPFTLRDIISVRQTNSDLVEFVRQTTRTNAAASVAEASATTGTSGTKPESAMAFEKVTAPVVTIAHWAPATKRAVSDAAQLRGLIDQELRDGLREEEEDQIVNGAGGADLTGISNTSNLGSQSWSTDLLTTTRKARTKVRTEGRAIATAYLLHPEDWERLDLEVDGEDRYYFGGPMSMGTPRLWGLPVVESEACTAGVGYVGDFRKAILWDREQASVTVSDSHADFFIRNMVAILAEERVAFGVTRPSAIIEMDLTA